MTIEFKRDVSYSKLLNPAANFEEEIFPIEFRIDPLTKEVAIVIEYRRPKLNKPDLSGIVTMSLEGDCPFCPETIDKLTPRFSSDFFPEGRIKVGEATVFPNAFPYMPYSALTVLDHQHFVSLPEFSEEMLADGFFASQIYLKRVLESNPEAKYCCINWNYMPPASSSQVHPHLQVLAGQFPLTYHRELLEWSQKYYLETGINYWTDFITEETRLKERYIDAIGNTLWFTSFAPWAWQLDVLVLFQERQSVISLPAEDVKDFCHGLKKVFTYMNEQNFYSFNLCLYSGVLGEDYFWTQARLIQRAYYPPLAISDCGSLRLLLDTLTVLLRPETLCQELRTYFE